MISKQTSLDLNGPILSFVQQPQSVSVSDSGSATFVGIATALFPVQDPPNPATNTGTLSYRWYADGFGLLTDGTFQGASITGSGTTTLTITNAKSPTANGLRLFVDVDYVPSAYVQPVGSAVTVGTGRSTGNAVNEILNSDTATLTVFPVLTVAQQPTAQTAAQTRPATFTTLGSLTDTTQGSISYRWQLNGNDLNDSATVIGSGTPSLSISLPDIGTNTVRAQLSHPTAGSIFTNTVNFNVVSAREIVNIELLPGSSGSATLYNWNLFSQGAFSIGPGEVPAPTLMTFYSPERDLDVFLDISANSGSNNGSYRGGQGGMSTLKMRIQQNVEYVITSISQVNNGSSIFLYRKGTLIASVGGGGNAGSGGNGGDGGGVNVAGGNGSGRGAGTGGILYTSGTLPPNGIFGSNLTTVPLKPGDQQASAPNGGRVLPCPKGYWYNRGYSACQDVGFVKFYTASGNEISNSTSSILRGFKAGYGTRNTAGRGIGGGGTGGNGATGGNGGTNGGGGGGGSGYTDGSLEIISTRQGGNTGLGRIIIRSAT
jgi:hypothetical protein